MRSFHFHYLLQPMNSRRHSVSRRQHPPAMSLTSRLAMALLLSFSLVMTAAADTEWPDQGWRVIPTQQTYSELLHTFHEAVDAEGMAVVTEAGPTEVAASRGETIPGNRVLGVFRNDFAVRIIRISVPAMIEAPVRFYVTEEDDGTATLSWKTPSHVFDPYMGQGEDGLRDVAGELDTIFEAIAERATRD